MEAEEKFDLITKDLQEVIGGEELKQILEKRDVTVYWGTAITGKPHIAYFLPILKVRDFLEAKCNVKILLADVHAFLDNLKAPFDLVKHRTEYYEKVITLMLRSLGIDTRRIEFVRGSDFQMSKEYVSDLYKISTLTTYRNAIKAGAQVVKQVDSPILGSMIYPCMQALDEEHLKVDVQFGGVDQRKIFTYAAKYLPKLGYKKRIHLMNPMIPGLGSEKMSSSDVYSKIDLLDTKKDISKKINGSFCEEGSSESGLHYLLKHIIFPIFRLKGRSIEVSRRDEGDVLAFESYAAFESAFKEKCIHPADLKPCVSKAIEEIISPIREEMKRYKDLINLAYP
jgi:tyrosyl-tRNA synthetase